MGPISSSFHDLRGDNVKKMDCVFSHRNRAIQFLSTFLHLILRRKVLKLLKILNNHPTKRHLILPYFFLELMDKVIWILKDESWWGGSEHINAVGVTWPKQLVVCGTVKVTNQCPHAHGVKYNIMTMYTRYECAFLPMHREENQTSRIRSAAKHAKGHLHIVPQKERLSWKQVCKSGQRTFSLWKRQ